MFWTIYQEDVEITVSVSEKFVLVALEEKIRESCHHAIMLHPF